MIDMLEEDPRLVILWAGYGFAKDYNQGKGTFMPSMICRNLCVPELLKVLMMALCQVRAGHVKARMCLV